MAIFKYLYVTGAGDETNIVSKYPDSGENWFKVSEIRPHDGDDTYLFTNSDDWQRDLYTIQDCIWGGTIVRLYVLAAIKALTWESGDTCWKMAIKTYSTVYEGEDRVRFDNDYSSYSYWLWNTNPYTGLAWTWEEIASLQIGIAIRRQPLSLGEVRVSMVHAAPYVDDFTQAAAGQIWTETDKLHYISETQEHKILGTFRAIELGSAGYLFVEGNYLHFINETEDERRQLGKDTGANASAGSEGQIWIDDFWIYYIDSSLNVRKLGTWMIGSSTLGVDTILHA